MDALYEAMCAGFRTGFARGFAKGPLIPKAPEWLKMVGLPTPKNQNGSQNKKPHVLRATPLGRKDVKANLFSDKDGRFHLEFEGAQWSSKRKRDVVRKARSLHVPVWDATVGALLV